MAVQQQKSQTPQQEQKQIYDRSVQYQKIRKNFRRRKRDISQYEQRRSGQISAKHLYFTAFFMTKFEIKTQRH